MQYLCMYTVYRSNRSGSSDHRDEPHQQPHTHRHTHHTHHIWMQLTHRPNSQPAVQAATGSSEQQTGRSSSPKRHTPCHVLMASRWHFSMLVLHASAEHWAVSRYARTLFIVLSLRVTHAVELGLRRTIIDRWCEW